VQSLRRRFRSDRFVFRTLANFVIYRFSKSFASRSSHSLAKFFYIIFTIHVLSTLHSLVFGHLLYLGLFVLFGSLRTVPDRASYTRGWIQKVLTPNDLFSWNNKYSNYTIILSRLYTSTMDSLFIFRLCTLTYSVHASFWSCEGVVFLVLSLSSHFTTYHVFPLPLSRANWRSLSLLWGSGPPFPKMAPPFTGSAHTPFPGSNTRTFKKIVLLMH
jgi:hypothetical protein